MGRKRERERLPERERMRERTLVCWRIRQDCDRAREGNLIECERKRKTRECGGTIVDSESHLASRLLFIVPCYSGFPRQSGRDAVKKK